MHNLILFLLTANWTAKYGTPKDATKMFVSLKPVAANATFMLMFHLLRLCLFLFVLRCHFGSGDLQGCGQLQHFPTGSHIRRAVPGRQGRHLGSGHKQTEPTSTEGVELFLLPWKRS